MTTLRFIRPMVQQLVAAALLPAILTSASGAVSPESIALPVNLKDWKGTPGYWSLENGIIIGKAVQDVPRNEFLWSPFEVGDFYMEVEVLLDPSDRNAGIQFRSRPVNEHGQALGYQADVGRDVWGRLYHEHGRGKLDWNGRGLRAVRDGEWNRYEILVSGHRIWTALNGHLATALEDPEGETRGQIAFQIHSGPPQTVKYRLLQLVRNPKVSLLGLTEAELVAWLNPPGVEARVPTSPKILPNGEASTHKPGIPPFSKGYEWRDGDVIAWVGGAGTARREQYGYLETLWTLAAGERRLHFRNICQAGDTVYERHRPHGFGTDEALLQRIQASVILVDYGRAEALSEDASPEAFRTAYEARLDEFAKVTPRLILVVPPFVEPAPPNSLLPDLSRFRSSWKAHCEVIRQLSRERRLPLVDLSRIQPEGWTRDGLQWNALGHWGLAQEIVQQLTGSSPLSGTLLGPEGRFTEPQAEQLRQGIVRKNELWQRHWWPSNWAFAFGDRIHVPSSQDHRPGMPRWFPLEIHGIIPLIGQAEDHIQALAQPLR